MALDISLRPGAPEEAATLSALCRRAKASHGYDEEFMNLLASDGDMVITAESIVKNTFMVAESEGRVLGFAHLMPVDRLDTIYLEDLFVEPDVQGMGVGRALFTWALKEAACQGYDWLEWDSDPNAAEFYEKLGAERIAENRSELRDGRMIPKFRQRLGQPGCWIVGSHS